MLKGYIDKIWVYESSGPIADNDLKLIVPNGRIKLIIPFRDARSDRPDGSMVRSKAQSIALVGFTDLPSVLDSEANNPSGTIGIEFNPRGAYRFFRINYLEIKNQMNPLSDVLGLVAKQLEEQIADSLHVTDKIDLLQKFLLNLFLKHPEDSLFEYCAEKIRRSKGNIKISELERETGYSSRWLNMKFMEKIGVSPKNLAEITRFQVFYKNMTLGLSNPLVDGELYDYYYDQSHFIKNFKRFTGLPPTQLAKATNDFSKIFHQE